MGAPLIGQSTDKEAAGVLGEGVTADIADAGTGVYGRDRAGKGNGVIGYSEEGRGVWGHSKGTGIGVLGESASGAGVSGHSEESYGLRGASDKSAGIRGSSGPGNGTEGWSTDATGVVGKSETVDGVRGETDGSGIGVLGTSKSGIGIYGTGGRLAGYFKGDIEVTGDIKMTNADCAEDFDIAGVTAVDPGTVMVLDDVGSLRASRHAFDRRVVGVISGGGDYKAGIVLDRQRSSGNRQPIALMGKVFCKVDAQFGAIAVGDLLTTSPTPGHAMKTDDPMRAFGAVIGKALRALEAGQGMIPILIALQ